MEEMERSYGLQAAQFKAQDIPSLHFAGANF